MTCYRATILATFKGKNEKGGILKCLIHSTDSGVSPTDLGDESVTADVVYTSPYSNHADGALIAIPAATTDILVENIGGVFYYLTSIIGDDQMHGSHLSENSDQRLKDELSINRPSSRIYDGAQFPDPVILKHPAGNLTMKREVSLVTDKVDEGKIHNSFVKLESRKGKVLQLDDSKEVNATFWGCMSGRNKDTFDGIKISGGGKNKHMGPRCISMESEFTNSITSRAGSLVNKILNGGNFVVANTSTRQPSPDELNYGNINLGTEFKDVNIIAGTKDVVDAPTLRQFPALSSSKIFIEANRASPTDLMPPLVRIHSDGSIDIYSNDTNPLTGVINIRAVGNLNLESTLGNINMSAPLGSINLLAPTMGVNIQGSNIKLNDPIPLIIPPFLTTHIPSPILRGYLPFPIWLV